MLALTRPRPIRPQVARLRRRLEAAKTAGERGRILFDLVPLFRETRAPAAWALILEAVAPTLEIRAARFRLMPAMYGLDDVIQELTLALRETALTIPLESPAYLERRLVLRAANRVGRLLKQEYAKQRRHVPLEILLAQEEGEDEDEED